MRVAVIGLSHESNTFLPTLTEWADFEVHRGGSVIERRSGSHHEIAGFLDGVSEERLEPVPVFDAVATPSGTITAPTFRRLVEDLLIELRRVGPCDGVLAAAHGAAVAEDIADADGWWLAAVRREVGPGIPIVATADAHANLTPAMLAATDALITYRTNPHLDTHQRGLEAAALLARTLSGEVRPVAAGAYPPLAINILQQDPSSPPCLPSYELAAEMRTRPGILAVSIALGFPYADVPEVGTSFSVVADGDAGLAADSADELARELLARRDDFRPHLIAPARALDLAAAAIPPVLLLDMGDNVGGGSAADGTTLAALIVARGGPSSFVSLYDPAAAALAHERGVGGSARFSLGGHTDALHGPPLHIDARVRSLHEGRFVEPEVRHGGGDRYDMGATAILDTDVGLTVQVTSRRIPPFSLGQLTSCGLDPGEFHILVAKGVHAPVPAYSPVCRTVIRADTPGSTAADMAALPFHRRRVPLFPLEELTDDHRGSSSA
jgi:microcystin degradation protein MlrC